MPLFPELADAIGTPFYVYDADVFRARARRLATALGDAPHLVCYSAKANDALALLALAGREGLGVDIVSGGEGSELYGVHLPDEYVGLGVDELSARLRREHRATLLAVVRDGKTFANPDSAFRLERGDEAVVVAVSLGTLSPLVATKATGMPS